MQPSRRRFLQASLASIGAISLAGCSLLDDSPDVNFSGNLHVSEPLVTGIELSEYYPTNYSASLTSEDDRERLRMEYIEENYPQITNIFEETDLDSESLVLFGMFLPSEKELEPIESSIGNDELEFRYKIRKNSNAPAGIAINTQIRRLRENLEGLTINHLVEF